MKVNENSIKVTIRGFDSTIIFLLKSVFDFLLFKETLANYLYFEHYLENLDLILSVDVKML